MAKKPIKKLGKKSKKVLVNIVEDAGSDTESANDEDMYDSNSESDTEHNKKDNIDSKENNDEVDDDDKFGDELEDKEEKEGDDEKDEDEDEEIDDNQGDDKCFYKYADKKHEFSDEEDDDDDGDDEIEDNADVQFDTIISKENRTTKPRLTKYEYVRLLTDRTKQLSLGAKPMIKNTENLSDLQISRLEIEHKIVPLIIERPLPNGQLEIWKISELEIDLVH